MNLKRIEKHILEHKILGLDKDIESAKRSQPVGGGPETDPVWNAEKADYIKKSDSDIEYVPYTGANSDINLNNQDLLNVGNIEINGGLNLNIVTVNDTYQVLDNDYTIVCNKTTAFSVNLPLAVIGQTYHIKNINIGIVTVDGKDTDTIDGNTTYLLRQWDGIKIQCYEVNKWVII